MATPEKGRRQYAFFFLIHPKNSLSDGRWEAKHFGDGHSL